MLVFKAITFSKINYGIELYAKKETTNTKKLQKVQNKLLKILYNKHRRHSTNDLHRSRYLLKIKDLAILRQSLIGHQVLNTNKM